MTVMWLFWQWKPLQEIAHWVINNNRSTLTNTTFEDKVTVKDIDDMTWQQFESETCMIMIKVDWAVKGLIWDDEHGQTWRLDYDMLTKWRWTYRQNVDMRMMNRVVMIGLMSWWCMWCNVTNVCINYKLGLVHVVFVYSKKN